MSRIRVPLAVDVQVGVDVGPMRLPARTVGLVALSLPLAFVVLQSGAPFSVRLGLVAGMVLTAVGLGTPTREGIWIVAYWLHRIAGRWMPTQLNGGVWSRGAVEITEDGTAGQPGAPMVQRHLAAMAARLHSPRCAAVEPGLLNVDTVGWRAVVSVSVPPGGVGSAAYERWCDAVLRWLRALESPAQLITRVCHADRTEAELAWDTVVRFEPRDGPLAMCQRAFVGELAAHSLALRSYVVFAPRAAAGDGTPLAFSMTRGPAQASRLDAERLLDAALRQAGDAGVVAAAASSGQIADDLLATSLLTAQEAACVPSGVWIAGRHVAPLVVTTLPADLDHGVIVDALRRAEITGAVSLHVYPVRLEAGRRALRHQRAFLRRALRDGSGEVDAEVALADVERLQADIAAGTTAVMRTALTVEVQARSRTRCHESAERVAAILTGYGFGVVQPTVPGVFPALAAAPGMAPLRRSLVLTTDSVVARLLPALGTPFTDITAPPLGHNVLTGAATYLDVFSLPNHNMLVAGSSGAGKSVAVKTLLAGHCLQGASAVVLDPDSEYEPLITLLGGRYFELADAAINPLGVRRDGTPDQAAEVIVSALSVMAGDPVSYDHGRPIRRLPAEDKAWLHHELVGFLLVWRIARTEPTLSDLVSWLDDSIRDDGGLSDAERDRYRRLCRRVSAYTQGVLAEVFDRPSSFRLEPGRPVGIGLRGLSLRYAADTTPAMVVVLSHVLDLLDREAGPLVIVVDEAHTVTSDPDAGQVLDQVVRRARKRGAGVWMPSQRIEEFLATELGLTLASTASTKLLLGQEDSVAERVRRAFELDEPEGEALTPPVTGRGVLIAGRERAIVDVIPGPALMPWVCTDPAVLSERGAA
jgi:conjugal transfer ATP-binding protein TraC